MSLLSPFKNKPASATPAMDAYLSQMKQYNAKNRERLHLLKIDERTKGHRDIVTAAMAKVGRLQDQVDSAVAQDLYGDGPKTDTDDLRKQLVAAKQEADLLAPMGRAAEVEHQRVSSQAAALHNEMLRLHAPLPKLLHTALIEMLDQQAAAFRAAEDAFRELHRSVFRKAAAADRLAQAHGIGIFAGYGTYGELHISRPNMQGYDYGSRDPWTNQLEWEQSQRSLDVEADKLINDLLNGAA